MDQKLVDDILKLPIHERFAIAGEIWDSVADEEIPTPPALLRELRRRLAEYRKHPERGMTMEAFRRKMNQHMKQYTKNHRRSA